MVRSMLVLSLLLMPIACWAEGTTTFDCTYTKYADGEKVAETEKIFTVTFVLDEINKKAFIKGSKEEKPVAVMATQDGMSFLEGRGATLTTISMKDGASVHSRHTFILGAFLPSQYYGKCEVK